MTARAIFLTVEADACQLIGGEFLPFLRSFHCRDIDNGTWRSGLDRCNGQACPTEGGQSDDAHSKRSLTHPSRGAAVDKRNEKQRKYGEGRQDYAADYFEWTFK